MYSYLKFKFTMEDLVDTPNFIYAQGRIFMGAPSLFRLLEGLVIRKVDFHIHQIVLGPCMEFPLRRFDFITYWGDCCFRILLRFQNAPANMHFYFPRSFLICSSLQICYNDC